MVRVGILISVVLMCLGVVLFVVVLTPESLGKALAAPLCAGDLVVVQSGRNSTELLCRTGAGETSFTEIYLIAMMAGFLGGTLVIVLTIVGWIRAGNRKQRRLIAEGIPAQARVLAVDQTAAHVNSQPVLRYRLEIQPPSGLAFEAQTHTLVPLIRIGQITPGMTIPVLIDPNRPENFVIDWDRLPIGGQPIPLKDKLVQLEESLQAGLITEAEYQTARQRVLNEF